MNITFNMQSILEFMNLYCKRIRTDVIDGENARMHVPCAVYARLLFDIMYYVEKMMIIRRGGVRGFIHLGRGK